MSSRQPESRVLCLSLPLLAKNKLDQQTARAWGCLNDTPTPFLCLEQSLATVPTSKRCRALFSSFVTAHSKLIRSSAQDGRKMVAKPKKMGHRFYRYPIDFIVVRPAGIEPAAYCLGGNRSIRLSYERASYLVKQSDARCQVEAGGRKVCISGAEGRPFCAATQEKSSTTIPPAWRGQLRNACAAGAAWDLARCPWPPARRRPLPAG